MVEMVNPVVHQEAFRFGSDGAEASHGWLQNQSVDITVGDEAGTDVGFGTGFLLRIRIAETAGATSTLNNQTVELQYSHNGGTFTNVTGSSSVVQAIAGTPTDGDDTTERLTGGSTTFITPNDGYDDVDGVAGGGNMDIAGNEYAEVLYSIQVISGDVSDTDTIDFRITRNTGTLMDNEATADEPRITIDKAAVTASGTGWETAGWW